MLQMSNIATVDKRTQSNKKYMDALQEQYSKLNIIRVDFGYKKNSEVTLEEVNKDLNRLLSNRRKKRRHSFVERYKRHTL